MQETNRPAATTRDASERQGDATPFFDLSAYPLMLHLDEVAEICRCDLQAVRRRINRGELAHTKIGSMVRVPRESLRAYLLTQTRFGRDTSKGSGEERDDHISEESEEENA